MDVGRHPNIKILAYSEVENVSGTEGHFSISVRKKARYVDEDKCTGCGECAEKCPTKMVDSYNLGLDESKAIYRYFPQGIPSAFTINAKYCRQFQSNKKCGICKKKCQAEAIDYEQEDKMIEITAGAVIVATGYDLFDASKAPEYGYGRISNVISALEMERLLSAGGPTEGHLLRPSDMEEKKDFLLLEKKYNKQIRMLERYEKKFEETSESFYPKHKVGDLKGKEFDKWGQLIEENINLTQQYEEVKKKIDQMTPSKSVAFIQCVGSRDIRFFKHCSGFCCMHSIKEAIIAKDHQPDIDITIFGMDIRAVGKGFEEYRNRCGEDINFIRSRIAEITEDNRKRPVIWYEDTKFRKVRHLAVDLVVLATACVPGKSVNKLADILEIELNEFGFFKTGIHQPMDTSRPGIFTCGCALGPSDIPESVTQASSAAARAANSLKKNNTLKQAS